MMRETEKITGLFGRKQHYDERQLSVRGSVAMHSLLFGGLLLAVSGVLLSGFQVKLLSTWQQDFLVAMLTMIYFIAESVIRGAYFDRTFSKRKLRFAAVMWFFYSVFVVIRLSDFFTGKVQFSHLGQMTTEGFEIFIFAWVVITYGIILLGWYRDHRA